MTDALRELLNAARLALACGPVSGPQWVRLADAIEMGQKSLDLREAADQHDSDPELRALPRKIALVG